jgi:hypothetical protein
MRVAAQTQTRTASPRPSLFASPVFPVSLPSLLLTHSNSPVLFLPSPPYSSNRFDYSEKLNYFNIQPQFQSRLDGIFLAFGQCFKAGWSCSSMNCDNLEHPSMMVISMMVIDDWIASKFSRK